MERTALVYLGSSSGNKPIFVEAAKKLGKALAQKGFRTVYGGANVGTMKALADGVSEGKGEIIGVFPTGFKGKKENSSRGVEVMHHNLSRMIEVADMAERKKKMEEMSSFCIVLPGSFGTLDELFTFAINKQLGYNSKPIFILNLEGYYDPLIQMMHNMAINGFIRSEELDLITFCNSIDDILEKINTFV